VNRTQHGTLPGGYAAGDGLPAGVPRGRAARDLIAAETLQELRHAYETNTALVARIAGQIINDTLEVATYVIPATGVVSNQYKVAAGCIEVENFSNANQMIVVARADATGSPPSQGTGMRPIAKGTCRVVALNSHAWSIYGTAGDVVSVQAFTAGAAPGRGLGSVNSGGA